MAAPSLTPSSLLLVLRAARPAFSSRHDRVAFLLHAGMLTAGFRLVAAGEAALAPAAAGEAEEQEVGVEGWNQIEGVYAFRYAGGKGEGLPEKASMKCLAIENLLLVDAIREPLEPLNAPIHMELNVTEFVTESDSTNYAEHFNNLDALVERIYKELVVPLTRPIEARRNEGGGLRDERRSSVPLREDTGRDWSPPIFRGGGERGTGYGPFPVPGVGSNDLLPGGGGGIFPPLRGGGLGVPGGGGMMLGPNDPYWGRVGGPDGSFPPGEIPGVPPGARYDPIGPPGVPGFEPGRFIRGGRGSGQPPVHPDLQFFRDD